MLDGFAINFGQQRRHRLDEQLRIGRHFLVRLQQLAVGSALVHVLDVAVAVLALPRRGIERIGRELRIDLPYRLAALAEQILPSRHHRILAQTLIETENAETAGKSDVAMIPRPIAHPFDQIL